MSNKPHHRHSESKPDAVLRGEKKPPTRTVLKTDPAKGSVRNLQELYTVAVGVALVKAMEVFVGPASEHVGRRLSTYGGRTGPPWSPYGDTRSFLPRGDATPRQDVRRDRGVDRTTRRLACRFPWLFIEAGILLAMALQLGELERFAWWLVFLLVFDSVWGLMVHLFLTSKPRGWTEFKWAIVNVPTAIVLG